MPEQAGQAPWGLLKEKSWGEGLGRLILHEGQTASVLKAISFPPTT
jgi:hypothetical protein